MLMFPEFVSRMKLPNGPTLFGGVFAFATRPAQPNEGGDWTRVPSHAVLPDRAMTSYENVCGSSRVASGKRYGMLPNPALMRLAAAFTGRALRQKFGPFPVTEHPSW